jgi:glycosyltransferase involved in cell wall biosynthesis
MTARSVCITYNNVDDSTSIGKVAKWAAQQALEAGWSVTVVARDLDPVLADDVEFVPLYIPPRLHLVQWLAARVAFLRAIRGRRFDVVHVHQAQLAADADIMQCHYLSRPAYERGGFLGSAGLRNRVRHGEQYAVMLAEDRYLRHWNPGTSMLFDSELLRDEFHRLYGPLARESVLLYPAPAVAEEIDRVAARAEYAREAGQRPVVGFLGGSDPRKGLDLLLPAIAESPDLFLLAGGAGSEDLDGGSLDGRYRGLGHVDDVATFLAACDALIVPSRFEPFGLVCFEAAAAGVPVIATQSVGALQTLLAFNAGLQWDPLQPLAPLVEEVMQQRRKYADAARQMAATHSADIQGQRLLKAYEDVCAAVA